MICSFWKLKAVQDLYLIWQEIGVLADLSITHPHPRLVWEGSALTGGSGEEMLLARDQSRRTICEVRVSLVVGPAWSAG